MSKEIILKIVLQKPVSGCVYGLQKGKGPGYETVQAQVSKGEDLTFDFAVQAKESNGSISTLGGPFVQGTPGNRFVYIGIGSYAGQMGAPCSGRLKIPLSEADFQNPDLDDGAHGLHCTVPASTADGKPVFATVKAFGGWHIRKLSA